MNKMTMLVMFLSLAFVGKTEARGTGTFTTTTPKPGLFVFDKIHNSVVALGPLGHRSVNQCRRDRIDANVLWRVVGGGPPREMMRLSWSGACSS